jgi:hypothetical protein
VTQIFAIIQLLLKLFGLWESFCNYTDKLRAAEAAAKTERREKAVDDATKAKTAEEAWDAEERIVANKP